MPKITPFRMAAGILGIAALAKISAFAIALALIAGPAQARSLGRSCTAAPQNEWLSLEALQSKVEAVGFNAQNWQVQKAILTDSCAEFYVTAKTGARMELFVNPATGNIIDGR
jgi:hypothetical protein